MIVIVVLAIYVYMFLNIDKHVARSVIMKSVNECARLPYYSFVDKKYIDEFNSLMKVIEEEILENKKINSLNDSLFQNYVELRAIVTIFKSFGDIDAYYNPLNTYLKEKLIKMENHDRI
jgi:hypothetical protein